MIKDSSFYLLSQVVTPLMNFITVPIVTSILSIEDYGFFVIYLATLNFMMMFGSSWLVTTVLRFQDRIKSNYSFTPSLLCLQLILSFVVILVSIIVDQFYTIMPRLSGYEKATFFLLFFVNSYFELYLGYCRSANQSKKYSIYFSVSSVLKSIVAVGLLWYTQSITYFFVGWLFISSLLLIFIYFKEVSVRTIKMEVISRKEMRSVVSYGFPFVFTGLGGLLISQIDKYMLLNLNDSAKVGIYNVTFLVANYSVGILATVLIMASYPIIVEKWESKKSDTEYAEFMDSQIDLFLGTCLPALIGVILIGRDLISVVFNDDFLVESNVLIFIATSSLVASFLQYLQKSFVLHKHTVVQSYIYLFGAFVNIVLNYVLIPRYGVLGASISTLVTFLIIFTIVLFYNYMKWKIMWFGNVLEVAKIITSSAVMFVTVQYFKEFVTNTVLSILVSVVLGVVVYISMVLTLRVKSIKRYI